jgi:uncharacterized integral membrane protein
MKALLLIAGILLVLFGVLISLGFTIEFIEGTSEYPVGINIIGLLLVGIVPIAGGLFVCRRALLQRDESQKIKWLYLLVFISLPTFVFLFGYLSSIFHSGGKGFEEVLLSGFLTWVIYKFVERYYRKKSENSSEEM